LHYLVAENLNLKGYEGYVYDFSNYEDINELYLMADVLITDYSSVFFDYANLRHPMIFYVYDLEEYRDTLRGLYFYFVEKETEPNVRTTDELIEEMKKIERGSFHSENLEAFDQRFCYLEDGQASERVTNVIFRDNK